MARKILAILAVACAVAAAVANRFSPSPDSWLGMVLVPTLCAWALLWGCYTLWLYRREILAWFRRAVR